MERTMSVEEKIKKAEEIYARRHEQENRNTATVYLHGKEKKDIKLFKKMILQMIVCLLIYFIFYTIQNNNYIFSEDFINKAKEILSYDTNFTEIYNNITNGIENLFNNQEDPQNDEQTTTQEDTQNDEQTTNQDDVQNSEQNDSQDSQQQENTTNEGIGGGIEQTTANTEEAPQLTEEEQQILQIKSTTTFIKPVQGTISSKYGLRNPTTSTVPKNHTGTDIAANLGTKILSSTDGEVVVASSEGDYGNHLKIKIGDVSLVYAHCNKLYVKEGDKVTQGQEIAEVGSTGNSTGPHLHFEIRLNEKTVDPETILEL